MEIVAIIPCGMAKQCITRPCFLECCIILEALNYNRSHGVCAGGVQDAHLCHLAQVTQHGCQGHVLQQGPPHLQAKSPTCLWALQCTVFLLPFNCINLFSYLIRYVRYIRTSLA